MKNILLTALIFNAFTNIYASKNDSLLSIIKLNKADTSHVEALLDLSNDLWYKNTDSSILLSKNALDVALKIDYKYGLCDAYKILGVGMEIKGEIDSSYYFYKKALKIAVENGYKKVEANIYSDIGLYFELKSNVDSAKVQFEKSIALNKELGEMSALSMSNNNMGLMYARKGNYEEALKYLFQAIEVSESIEDLDGYARTGNNVAIIYKNLGRFDEALDMYLKCLEIRKKQENIYFEGQIYSNLCNLYIELKHDYIKAEPYAIKAHDLFSKLGAQRELNKSLLSLSMIAQEKGDLETSEKYVNESIELCKSSNDNRNLFSGYMELANIYTLRKNKTKAEFYIDEAEKIALELAELSPIKNLYKQSSELYFRLNDIDKLYYAFHRYDNYKDSLQKNDINQQLSEINTKYETAKKEKEIAELNETKAQQEAQLELDKKQQTIYLIGIVLLTIVLILIFIGLRQKQKANIEIEKQKKIAEDQRDVANTQKSIVEQKNQDILESINYAKRIQEAILPQDKLVKEYLENSFILYKPKDIVSGDFYWFQPIENKLLFAAVDCTGHGVPGAFMSIVGSNGLNKAVKEQKLVKPSEILDALNTHVIEVLKQESTEIKDGMDIAICNLDLKSNKLQYSGAYNPLYIIRNKELIEIKADRQAIGASENNFVNHEIDLLKGDNIYVFSDGFIDQFGGDNGKKYSSKRFKEFLISNADKKMSAQREALIKEFDNWKKEDDQLDDICIIGVSIN